MSISNDGQNYSEWENFSESKNWTLPGSDGEKTYI